MTPQGGFAIAVLRRGEVPQGLIHARRFSVYRNNVMAALVNALAVAFPAVKRLVGDEFFAAMAGDYARRAPPRSPVLIEYGGGFAGHIAAFEPARTLPYLADVARLERAWWQAYHAPDVPALTPEAFQALELETVRLVFHPSMHLVVSPSAALSIWERQRGDGSLHGLDVTRPETALIWRRGQSVEVQALAPADAAAWSALAAGKTLAGVLAAHADPQAFLTMLILSETVTGTT